jgi:hypothetical protein
MRARKPDAGMKIFSRENDASVAAKSGAEVRALVRGPIFFGRAILKN